MSQVTGSMIAYPFDVQENSYPDHGAQRGWGLDMHDTPPLGVMQNTLFINGGQFKILLYIFKLALLTSSQSKNYFQLPSSKWG